MTTRALVAIGGNSLTQFNQVGTVEEQFENAATTCAHLAGIVERGWEILLTHGNGPQVGNMIRRVELTAQQIFDIPLHVIDANIQGAMGYMLQQGLRNELTRRNIRRKIATFITQVEVDPEDPAFGHPTKPVGNFYSEEDAREKMASENWKMVEDSGRGWRRVVASPHPVAVVESEAIAASVSEVVPIAGGGGGIPVVCRDGMYTGVDAVVDKDRTSAILARDLDCDLFIILTAVDEVKVNFGKPDERSLREADREEMRAYLREGQFPPGSMGPKVEAALAFLDTAPTPGRVIITDPDHLDAALDGKAGTCIA